MQLPVLLRPHVEETFDGGSRDVTLHLELLPMVVSFEDASFILGLNVFYCSTDFLVHMDKDFSKWPKLAWKRHSLVRMTAFSSSFHQFEHFVTKFVPVFS